MPNFEQSVLSPDLDTLAGKLSRYCDVDDFSLHPKVAAEAYRQIVTEGGVKFRGHTAEIKKAILEAVNADKFPTGKQLAAVASGADFKWPLYERCLDFCEQQKIDLLDWQLVASSPEKAIAEKYEQLFRFIRHRAISLRQIANRPDNDRFYPELIFVGDEADERKEKMLAFWLDDEGFDAVVVDGRLCKPLPLFPSSQTAVGFRYRRRGQRLAIEPKTVKKSGVLGFFKRG